MALRKQTTWKQIAVDTSVDDAGIAHMSIHLLETDSGEDFVISISGRGAAEAGYFVAALRAVSEMFLYAGSGKTSPAASFVPTTKAH